MIKHKCLAAALICLAVLSDQSAAFGAEDGDWPCVQRKVPEIGAAAIWSGPSLDAYENKWRDDAAIAPLVERLAARRTPMEEAREAITSLAETPKSQQKLLALFAGLLATLNRERGEVIAGIERYGHNQKQLAEQLRQETAKLETMRDAPDADAAKIDELNQKLHWDTRIFDERQKSLRYVCEVPTLIEQRLFALAREIQNTLK